MCVRITANCLKKVKIRSLGQKLTPCAWDKKMDENKIKILVGPLEDHKTILTNFLIKNFYKNPLNVLLPIPEGERGTFYETFIGNYNVLAYQGSVSKYFLVKSLTFR